MNSLQKEIIQNLGCKPSIDPETEIDQRSKFLESYLEASGMLGFIIGVSGGQDSLLAGLIAQKAVNNRQRLGHQASLHAILLPYGQQSDRQDAKLAVATIAPNFVHDMNIQPATDDISKSFEIEGDEILSDFDKGNIKARMRMIAQYAIASQHKLLVIGTDHAAEAVTGFYTKYGDGAADILPLSGLNKRQGRQLLDHLGVPEIFTTKTPTADLLDDKPGQSDETELGVTYDQIDDYLEGKPINGKVAEKIESLYISSQHKRAMPVGYQGTIS
ncbi:NAD(+) synthase [Candidatus Saccharibacteria bacterium]|nr:MAG: NAD(+) synthase [Candidatus Saccharibacteria bacterium]